MGVLLALGIGLSLSGGFATSAASPAEPPVTAPGAVSGGARAAAPEGVPPQLEPRATPTPARVDSVHPAWEAPAAEVEPAHLLEAPSRLRLAVLSDLNGSYGSVTYGRGVHAATRALIDSLHPDLVLITGDMVAGQRRGLDYGAMWRGFHSAVTEPLGRAGISIAPTPGNHDASPATPFAAERREYARQWKDAGRVPDVAFQDHSNYPFHYSFEHGGVFFASIDAAAVGPIGERQRRWLERQLAATRAAVKIVFGHLPVYPFAVQREREVLSDDALAALLRRQQVTAYISGHHHAYYPGVVDGVRHIAMPCLGSGARRLVGHERRSPSGLVVLEIDGAEVTILEALRAPEFVSPILRDELPQQLELHSARVVRDDRAGFAPLWMEQTSRIAFWERTPASRARSASRATNSLVP